MALVIGRGRQKKNSNVRRNQANNAGGMGSYAKKHGCPIEAGKGKAVDSPLKLLERNIALTKP